MKSSITKQPSGTFICIKSRGAYLLCLIGIVLLLMISINLIIESHSNFESNFIIRSKDISISKIAEYVQALEWSISYPDINSSYLMQNISMHEVTSNQTNLKPTIAYVFAGSARSFVCPKVHWSIRSNLIDALGGVPKVFIRMSTEDNLNTKTGTGKLWAPTYNDQELNETLKVLNPTEIEYFSLSEQLIEMRRNYPSIDHEVFRMNDRRRYSMYYHRCMAYRMVQRYEADQNMRFDWVVLVRLDAQWLDPVLPIEAYASDRVWLTETGYVLLNDQFMLIPRKFSDYLYDLNTKVVQKGVYCLGGPDVETWKCDKQLLQSKGVNNTMIEATLQRCCADVLRLLATPSRKGVNELGFSETIHLRHLAAGQIPVALAYFPVLLTRLQGRRKDGSHICNPECGRLYYNAKEYFFHAGVSVYPNFLEPVWPDSRFRSLSTRDQVACEFLNSPEFEWNPISAQQFHQLTASNNGGKLRPSRYRVNYSTSLYSQQKSLHSSILLHPAKLEAWRIHPAWNAEGCLTYNLTSKSIVWDECTDHFRKRGGLRMDPSQLFFLHVEFPQYPSYGLPMQPALHEERDQVRATQAQAAAVPSAYDVSRRTEIQLGGRHDFLTANPNVHFYRSENNFTRVVVLDRDPFNWNFHRVLCLTLSKPEKDAALTFEPCASQDQAAIGRRRLQQFLVVRGALDGSHPLTTIGHLKPALAPHLCVSRYFNHRVNMETDEDARDSLGVVSSIAHYPAKGNLFLHHCTMEGRLFLTNFEFEKIVV